MVRNHGYRNKTRELFRKAPRTRGLPGLSRFMVDYSVGDQVDIIADSTFQKRGLPHRHFHGKTGVVASERGRCYEIKVYDGNKLKTLFCGREHIRLNKDFQIRQQKEASAE
jgi:large subunit ribosomal protein L21e